jgi:hypothetical protein
MLVEVEPVDAFYQKQGGLYDKLRNEYKKQRLEEAIEKATEMVVIEVEDEKK